MRGEIPDDATHQDTVADALAAVALVKSLYIRDAMDLFLEARAACAGRLCRQLSGGSEEFGHEELLGGMCRLRSCLVHTVEAAFALFASKEVRDFYAFSHEI